MENDNFFWFEIRPGVKELGGSPPPRIPRSTRPRDFLRVVSNAKNGHGLSTRATREKRADRKRNDSKTQVPAVATLPAPALNLPDLPPSFSFLAILTTYFNEFSTIYLSQSNT